MKILVCGDREWVDREMIFNELDLLHQVVGISSIVEGCARGADTMAEEWAVQRHVTLHHFPADWKRLGKSAGPHRNRKMIEMKPHLVLAFHRDIANSRGTADMVRVAKEHDVDVRVIG